MKKKNKYKKLCACCGEEIEDREDFITVYTIYGSMYLHMKESDNYSCVNKYYGKLF